MHFIAFFGAFQKLVLGLNVLGVYEAWFRIFKSFAIFSVDLFGFGDQACLHDFTIIVKCKFLNLVILGWFFRWIIDVLYFFLFFSLPTLQILHFLQLQILRFAFDRNYLTSLCTTILLLLLLHLPQLRQRNLWFFALKRISLRTIRIIHTAHRRIYDILIIRRIKAWVML